MGGGCLALDDRGLKGIICSAKNLSFLRSHGASKGLKRKCRLAVECPALQKGAQRLVGPAQTGALPAELPGAGGWKPRSPSQGTGLLQPTPQSDLMLLSGGWGLGGRGSPRIYPWPWEWGSPSTRSSLKERPGPGDGACSFMEVRGRTEDTTPRTEPELGLVRERARG